jgi:hypothetical protein
MEIYAALLNCTLEFIDNAAPCNTSIVYKGLFPSSQKHKNQRIKHDVSNATVHLRKKAVRIEKSCYIL